GCGRFGGRDGVEKGRDLAHGGPLPRVPAPFLPSWVGGRCLKRCREGRGHLPLRGGPRAPVTLGSRPGERPPYQQARIPLWRNLPRITHILPRGERFHGPFTFEEKASPVAPPDGRECPDGLPDSEHRPRGTAEPGPTPRVECRRSFAG